MAGTGDSRAAEGRQRRRGARLPGGSARRVRRGGRSGDRELLARAVFDARPLFAADASGIGLLVPAASLPGEAMAAAARIAASPGTVGRLQEIAARLGAGGPAHVATVAAGLFSSRILAAALPPVIVLDGDTGSLPAELTQAVPVIHDLQWGNAGAGSWLPGAPAWYLDPFVLEPVPVPDGAYAADTWLEGLAGAGGTLTPRRIPVDYSAGEWYRVRHSVLATAQLIAAEANRLAPGFVQDQGTIGIEVIPVGAWSSGPRIRATFTGQDGSRRDLSVAGSGTARWAAAAITLACRRLRAGHRVVTGASGAPVRDPAAVRAIVEAARREPLTQASVRLEPSDAPAVYIADEPEAHLHPAAIASVRDWLTRLARTAATVLAATHSPMLLDSDSQLTRRVLVLPGSDGTHLQEISGQDDQLAAAAALLGITRGDLLLMTRLALFVEGPHDAIVLREWFGTELRAAGIRVFPLHGADNLLLLAHSEIVTALGVPIAVLTDNTDVPRARDGRPATREERAVKRLLDEAKRAGVHVKPVGLAQPDILYYLDEQVCREHAPDFPGWQAARAQSSDTPGRDWKQRVTSKYGLNLQREDIRRLAAECNDRGLIPPELKGKIRALTAHAAWPRQHRGAVPPPAPEPPPGPFTGPVQPRDS